MSLQLVLKNKLTSNTKAYACVTGLFVTITISLFFTWFSACVSHCVTYSTISAVRTYMAFLKRKLQLVFLIINLTIATKACPCVTGQLSTITILLLFTWFSACVSYCVTCFTIFAVKIRKAFLKTKHKPVIHVIENRYEYSPFMQKPVLDSQVCRVPLQSFFSSHGILHVLVGVSHILPFLQSEFLLHS